MPRKPPATTVTIKPAGELPMALEVMEEAILEIGKVGQQIKASKLKQRAVLLLIRDVTSLNMGDIAAVLNAIPELEKLYLKKE